MFKNKCTILFISEFNNKHLPSDFIVFIIQHLMCTHYLVVIGYWRLLAVAVKLLTLHSRRPTDRPAWKPPFTAEKHVFCMW